MANMSGALERMWHWQAQGAPFAAVLASTPALTYYFMVGIPKIPLTQILRRYLSLSCCPKKPRSYCRSMIRGHPIWLPRTRTAKYLREKGIKLLDSRQTINFYLTGDGPKLQDEFSKMLKE